jgi:peptidoglycan hydrolase-like protein with peptidoglycan-binding domain
VQACPDPVSPARTLAHPLLWLGSAGDGVRAVQSALAVAPSGSFDAATRARVLTYQSRHDLPRTGAMDRATWAALLPDTAQSLHPEWTAAEAREWLRGAGSPELHPGDTGRAVTALQAVLGLSVRDRTGYYGTRTARLADEVMSNGAKGSVITDTVWRMLG